MVITRMTLRIYQATFYKNRVNVQSLSEIGRAHLKGGHLKRGVLGGKYFLLLRLCATGTGGGRNECGTLTPNE